MKPHVTITSQALPPKQPPKQPTEQTALALRALLERLRKQLGGR